MNEYKVTGTCESEGNLRQFQATIIASNSGEAVRHVAMVAESNHRGGRVLTIRADWKREALTTMVQYEESLMTDGRGDD